MTHKSLATISVCMCVCVSRLMAPTGITMSSVVSGFSLVLSCIYKYQPSLWWPLIKRLHALTHLIHTLPISQRGSRATQQKQRVSERETCESHVRRWHSYIPDGSVRSDYTSKCLFVLVEYMWHRRTANYKCTQVLHQQLVFHWNDSTSITTWLIKSVWPVANLLNYYFIPPSDLGGSLELNKTADINHLDVEAKFNPFNAGQFELVL